MDWKNTALVIVDPQIDVLAPEGALWDLIGEQVDRLGVVDKLVSLRDAAEAAEVPVFYSWIRLTEDDYAGLEPKNGLQQLMASRKMMLPEEGGRFVPALEPTNQTILLKPRQGPSSTASDLNEQLRERGIETIVFAGMIANLCVESHVRDVADAGFRPIVVSDAIATTDDASLASTLGNFGLFAGGLVETSQAVESLRAA